MFVQGDNKGQLNITINLIKTFLASGDAYIRTCT